MAVDANGRPTAIYGRPLCEQCPFHHSGEARRLGVNGKCLEELGCRGRAAAGACPTAKWNHGVSWGVEVGAPCQGCTHPAFPESATVYSATPVGGVTPSVCCKPVPPGNAPVGRGHRFSWQPFPSSMRACTCWPSMRWRPAAPPGTLYFCRPGDLAADRHTHSLHGLGLSSVLDFMEVPRRPRVWVLGVQPARIDNSLALSPPLAAILPRVLARARWIVAGFAAHRMKMIGYRSSAVARDQEVRA